MGSNEDLAVQVIRDAFQSIQVSSVPIYPTKTATKFVIASASIQATQTVLLVPANPNRKGFTVYNNSTNSLYVLAEIPAVGVGGSNLIDFCASNAGPTSVVKWLGPTVYTGAIYGLRNAGSGSVTCWEFT